MQNMEEILEKVKDHRNKVIIINEKNSDEYKEYCNNHNIEIFDLSLILSQLLNHLSKEEKEQEAWDILKEWLYSLKSKEIIALNNIEYMFSPEVGNLDPIWNLNYYSRTTPQIIILFINAEKRGNMLYYSKEGRPDYNEMEISMNEFVLGWEE